MKINNIVGGKKMLKKYINFLIVIIMILGVFGLTACNLDNFTDYKAEAKKDIQAYADA